MRWTQVLSAFPCLSGVLSLPITGVYLVGAPFRSSTWASVLTSLSISPVVYVGSILVLTVGGCWAELCIAMLRRLFTAHNDPTIHIVEKGLYVDFYYCLAVAPFLRFIQMSAGEAGSLPV